MMEQTILEQLEQVRQDGSTNMLHRNNVQCVAVKLGLWELAGWLDTVSGPDYMAMLNRME